MTGLIIGGYLLVVLMLVFGVIPYYKTRGHFNNTDDFIGVIILSIFFPLGIVFITFYGIGYVIYGIAKVCEFLFHKSEKLLAPRPPKQHQINEPQIDEPKSNYREIHFNQ